MQRMADEQIPPVPPGFSPPGPIGVPNYSDSFRPRYQYPGVPGGGHPGPRAQAQTRPPKPAGVPMGLNAIGAGLCLAWLFQPWVSANQAGTETSTDGLHEFPQCFLLCGTPETSFCGVLLAVAAALTGIGCLTWFRTHRYGIAHAVAVGPPIILILTVINAIYLYANTQQRVQGSTFQSLTTINLGYGAVLSFLTGIAMTVLALIAAARAGRIPPHI